MRRIRPLRGGPRLEQAFGPPEPWDDYLISCNGDVTEAFYANGATGAGYDIDPLSTRYGALFLEVLPLVDTFLTDDPMDLMVYAPTLPPALERYAQYVRGVSVQRPCLACDGFITIDYKPNSLPYILTPQSGTICWPLYSSAGHPVAATMPEKFLQDVTDWMSWGGH